MMMIWSAYVTVGGAFKKCLFASSHTESKQKRCIGIVLLLPPLYLATSFSGVGCSALGRKLGGNREVRYSHASVSRVPLRRTQNCYNELKDGEIIAVAETAVRKCDLKKKKNDETAEVSVASGHVGVMCPSWVQFVLVADRRSCALECWLLFVLLESWSRVF